MATLKELSKKPDYFTFGHRLCAGCGIPIIPKLLYRVTDYDIIVASATGCLEVATTIYPYTSWLKPFIHSAFENSAATISGVEAMYQSLKKQGKIPSERKLKFVAFGGDGGTYDIGLQSLSGALERGHDILYICYDNGAYMNTGIQRSSATPYGAATTTSPAGKVIPGKMQKRKDLTNIAAAHHIEFVGQSAVSHWNDLATKLKKGLDVDGPAFMNVLSPCVPGWMTPADQSIEVTRIAVETCYWPLFEVEKGVMKVNYKPKAKLPVREWTKIQGRFRHLGKPEFAYVLDELQRQVDAYWDFLLQQEALTTPVTK
jgi:pyruvate ferredoxin oxidoreductase beta subunit